MDARNHTSSFMLRTVTYEEEIKLIITALSKVFVVKDLGPINTFVGCKIIEIKRKLQFGSISLN
jgi:hypothetical protein